MSKKVVIDEENPSAEAMGVLAVAIINTLHDVRKDLEYYGYSDDPRYIKDACEKFKSIHHLYFVLGDGLGKAEFKIRRKLHGEVD